MTNEIINMNKLDLIAGGGYAETAKDSFELYDRKLMDDHYTQLGTFFHWESYSPKVDDGWKKAGVHVVTHFAADNEYSINGKNVDRDTAIAHLQTNFKQRSL
ncbi:MAG: hypothetical protein IKD80_07420 [Selenomonadaceae bacterium]|nr:hypothetical protein [Selenomonadaceae bacterium]